MASKLKLAIIFQWLVALSALARAQVIGHIGTMLDENGNYTRANDSSQFFLNAQDPATTSGTVSKVSYCYILDTDKVAARQYRATVGFYQYRQSDRTYILSSSFNITKNYTGGEREFQCEDLTIPEVTVTKGEVIGVCSRDIDNTTGRLILYSKGEEESDSLFRDGGDESDDFCTTVPRSFTRDQIVNVTNRQLLVTASITEHDPTTSTPEDISTTADQTLGHSYLEDTNHGIIAGVVAAGAILVCCAACLLLAGCCYCCYCKRRRGHRSIYIKYYNNSASRSEEMTDSGGYMSFDEINRMREMQGSNTKAHVVGPENFTSSGSAVSAHSIPHADQVDSITGIKVVDVTTVVYSQVAAEKETTAQTDSTFERPASAEDEIYAQLENCGSFILKHTEIDLERHVLRKDPEIAVHLRKSDCSEGEKIKFLQEAAMMVQFKHPNVITCYGVLVDDLQATIVEESLKGHLKPFLQTLKPGESGNASRTLPKLLLNFSQQVAIGMKYLSGKGVVHGKVMASSIMLSSANVCKITDFSWSRDIANACTHHLSPHAKWSSPEVIDRTTFSTASDVWSYGCLLYEIWSLGRDPFAGESTINAIELVKIGWRLAPPPGTPKVIYELMIETWNPVVDQRPSFSELVIDLMRVESLVLNIPQKLLDSHPQCGELGASLAIGKMMYKNLQTLYQNSPT